MSLTTPSLLDIAIANGSDMTVGLIEETIKAVPEVRMGAARTIKGLNYKTLVRTALPTVGFRAANLGATVSKGIYENRQFEAFMFNPRWECDKMVADGYEDGAAAFIAMEAQGIMEAAFQTLGKQFYYGAAQGGDALGNPGVLAMYDAANMVIDAGGTTASTGSSVWALRFGPRDIQWIWGNEGQLQLSPLQEMRILDANGNPYTGYVQEIAARPGLQMTRKYAAGRIKKITADVGHTLTDAMISQLLALFPTGLVPDCLIMTRRSLQQLQQSRTAVNPTGAPAPIPQEAFGVPIFPTDSILNTEALTL
jgi:hypothetical protein